MFSEKLSIYMHPYIYYKGRYGGIARYVCELAEELWQQQHKIYLPIRSSESIYLQQSKFFPYANECFLSPSIADKGIASILRMMGNGEKAERYLKRVDALNALKNGAYDVIHPSYTNCTEILPYVKNTPLVVTVHDMIHELYPESFSPKDPSSYRKKLFAHSADRIIAISNQTKADLIHYFGIKEEKIDVVYHGNSLTLPANYESVDISLPERYILFVGHRHGYKNFESLLTAFSALVTEDDSLHLICAGGPPFSKDELLKLHELEIQQKVEQRFVSDEELAILYNRCLLFVYPSIYEGFGLPILEAFACRAPVLCARASCFPEIASDGAAYFTPGNNDELTHAIRKYINSSDECEKLRRLGDKRIQNFTWKQCASNTLASYRAAIAAH